MITESTKRLKLVLEGGAVKRFHVMPTLAEDNVAQHSFTVAWLVTILGRKPSATMLLACLQHDLTEVSTGDIPSTSKRRFGIDTKSFESEILAEAGHVDYVSMLTENEKRLLKVADILSGMLFCLKEITYGNSHPQIKQTFNNYRAYLESYRPLRTTEQEVLEWIYSQLQHKP